MAVTNSLKFEQKPTPGKSARQNNGCNSRIAVAIRGKQTLKAICVSEEH